MESGATAATASQIQPAKGKLGIMVVGMGAVATTLIAGVEAVRKGLAKPIGSLTQMGTIRLGKRTDARAPLIKEFVPLADLNDIVFTGWDIFEDNVYEAAAHAKVLEKEQLEQIRPYLEAIKPMPAVFDQYYVKRLNGTHVKQGKNKRELADQVRADIHAFRKTVNRVVVIWCGSTEIFLEPSAVHQLRRRVRKRPRRERHQHCAVANLRLCGAQGRRAFRERRAESDGRSAGDAASSQGRTPLPSAGRTSRPARPSSRPSSLRHSRLACSG